MKTIKEILQSKAALKRWANPEYREKIMKAQRGKAHKKRAKFSKETRRKMSETHKGKKFSEETIKRMSLSRMGNKSYFWKGGIALLKKKNGVYLHAYRAKKKGNGGIFSVGEWETLKAQYNWTCLSCKKQEPNIKLTIDHIIPISKGGSSNIENIQPLCKSCNSKKNARVISYLILKNEN